MTKEDTSHTPASLQDLNVLTGGAFAATQSQDRTALLKAWLTTQPALADLMRVQREMSSRDKGAAKVLKDAIEQLKREHHQEALVGEWTDKAQHVLAQHPFVIGDALAWIRDAAKAGAPLSKEPLSGLKAQLADRVKSVEDLQQQCMVQREGVHLLMQRMDNLSAREWVHAQSAIATLSEDVQSGAQALDKLLEHPDWPHVELRFPPQIEQSKQLLMAAWQAFEAASQLAQAATDNPEAPLPAVRAWADSIARLRQVGHAADHPKPETEGLVTPNATPRAVVKPELSAEELAQRQAVHAKRLELLEQAQALTQWVIDDVASEARKPTANPNAHEANESPLQMTQVASEPEQVVAEQAATHELAPVASNEAVDDIDVKDAANEAVPEVAQEVSNETKNEAANEGLSDAAQEAPAEPQPVRAQSGHWEPALPIRHIQQQLRTLREEWKALDHQAPVHHGLWRKFDQACNRAYPFVKSWLGGIKEQNQSHLAQRESLIAQVEAWTAQLGEQPDWKQVQRDLSQFVEQWRHCGHLNEKAFSQILPRWKAAIKAAEAPLHHATRDNIAQRKQLIEEAKALSEQSPLPIEDIKALQARWQEVSQRMPIDRRLSQKLWEAFRQPIDEAFARNPKPLRTASPAATSGPRGRATERGGAHSRAVALTPHEQTVMAAVDALNQAVSERDASRIQTAREALQLALRPSANQADSVSPQLAQQEAGQPSSPATPDAPKRLVAVRGDDRHKTERPAQDGPRRDRERGDRGPGAARQDRDAPLRGPRLSDGVFGAQRMALENADKAMRMLSAQAHGEQLRQLMQSWQSRDVTQLPSAKALGKSLESAQWQSWKLALSAAPAAATDATPWIRLDMAAGLPTPASDQAQRRAYQLQLLTQRHAATPEQTWPQEVATILAGPHTEAGEKRLQEALKVLLGRR